MVSINDLMAFPVLGKEEEVLIREPDAAWLGRHGVPRFEVSEQ
jgi:hypothetical protein